jgi:hypothetical protein
VSRLVIVSVLVLLALPAWAQTPTTPRPTTPTPTPTSTPTSTGTSEAEPTPGRLAIPSVYSPGVLFPPFVGPELLNPPLAQGPLILTPSFTLSEEFNDNIFQDNDNRESDFITQFTPGLRLDIREPSLRLGVGYSLTAEIYARNTELSNAANRHRFFADVSYQATPRLTLTLNEGFSYDRNSNAASVSGVSSGRQKTYSNVLAPGLLYQLTPRLNWRLFGSWELQRYESGGSEDSDTYRAGTGFDFTVTPRFGLTGGYDFAYIDINGEPTSYTHTPRVGFSYQITPSLFAAVVGGPSFLVSDGDTSVSPGVTATLAWLQRWGSMSVAYDRAIRAGSGRGGPSDTQSFAGSVQVTTLARGLAVGFSPRYTISESEDVARSRSDDKALTLNLSASYQLARYISLVGAYTFFNQRSDGGTSQPDVDQNRVFLGLQFGYPISFD